MQISLAFSANLLSETPSISPLKGEARPSKSPKTHPKIRDFRGPARTPQKSKIFRGPRKDPVLHSIHPTKQKTETQASTHI